MSAFSIASVIVILCFSWSTEEEGFFNLLEITMPASCKGHTYTKNYCFDKGDYYPTQEIWELMEQVVNKIKLEQIGNRWTNDPDCDDQDCRPVMHKNETIHYIVDVDNRDRVVVQIPGFHQLNDIVECRSTGLIGDTANFDASTNQNFHCEEMKVPLELYVVKTDWTGVEKVQVKGEVPTCCRCLYK